MVQILQKEAEAAEHHDMVMRDGQSLENRVVDWCSKTEIAQQVVYSLGLCALLLPTLPGVYFGRYSPVDIMALYAISMKLRKNSSALAECVRRSQSAMEGDKRRQDLTQEKPAAMDLSDAFELPSCEGHIELQNVKFSYDEVQVLTGVSFSCQLGKITAIVVPSGAGKSTIFSLIFRYYNVHNGSICIDGKDIRHLKEESLRRHVGLVP
jgi:ATP-binding cassette subfamily B protein